MCFLNKMDRTGADFYYCVDTIVKQLGSTPAVLQLPIGTEGDFLGVVDLVTNEAVVWRGEDLGASFDRIPIDEAVASADLPLVDEALGAKVKEYRETLIELAVEQVRTGDGKLWPDEDGRRELGLPCFTNPRTPHRTTPHHTTPHHTTPHHTIT